MLHDEIYYTFDLLNKVENESGTLAKYAILQNGKENEVLKQLLQLAYNPYIQFYIKKIPVVKTDSIYTYDTHYDNFLKLTTQLSKREVTGNAAIDTVKSFLSTLDATEYKWYTRVISKDLKIGLADKGINKVFPKLIPTYEVMLADKVDPNKLLDLKTQKILPERMTVQYKIDGYRLNIHRPSENEVVIRTRNGKIISGYKDLEESAQQLPVGYVYDGEIVAPEMIQWVKDNVAHSGIAETCRQFFVETMSHAFSKETDKKGVFIVFDVVPISDWAIRQCDMSYEDRFHLLQRLVQPLELSDIVPITSSEVYLKIDKNTIPKILDLFHLFLSQGWEGAMIKDLDAPYQWKRTKALLKMKLMDTVDLPVTEIYEGTGKYQGKMGGVYCDYKGNKLGVGSGFSDEQRQFFWDNPNEIVGKTIEIAYQAETINKQGQKSLSFPIFKNLRNDK